MIIIHKITKKKKKKREKIVSEKSTKEGKESQETYLLILTLISILVKGQEWKKKMYRLISPRHLGYILTVQSYSLYTFRVYQHQSFKLC